MRFIIWLIGAIAISGVISRVHSRESSAEKRPGGVRIEMAIPRTIRVGDPVVATVRLSNERAEDVVWEESNGDQEFHIVVRSLDRHGEIVLSRAQQRRKGILPEQEEAAEFDRRILHRLEPSKSVEMKVELSRIYDLGPGRYRVQVRMGVQVWTYVKADNGFWVSGEAEFRVK